MAVTPDAYDDEEELPLPAVSADVPVLTADQLEALDPELRDAYIAAFVQEVEESPLTPPQMRAHDLCGRVDELLYGGSAGSGKSHLAVWHADRLSRRYAGHRTLMLRTSFPELRRTLIAKSHEMIDTKAEPGVTWRAADKEFHYGNGSVIEFGYATSIEDVRQYLSAEYECIIIDESTEMTEEMIELIRSRLRTTKDQRALGVKPHLLLLTNPGGPGHAYHRDRYVNTTNNGEFVADLDERDDRGRGRFRSVAYVPARVWDNPHIDPDYEANLVAIRDPVRRAQYLDGDWSVHEGQFFSEFRTDIHVVAPFEIKPEWGWPIIGGYDWGYAAPACLLLGAVDQDRRIHIFREMYVEHHTAADQARIFKSWGIRPDYIAADPSIWRDTGVGLPISRQLMNAGMLPLRRANNERVAGWNAVREVLAVDPETDLPGLVIHSNCENLIRTLPDLPRDKNKPEDLDTRSEDHACFPGETLVVTLSGPRRIDQIEAGDIALNGKGEWDVVVAAGRTSDGAEVVDVITDSGAITCTPGHPLLTDSGWRRADTLGYTTTLAAWRETLNRSPSMAWSTAAIPSRSDGATAPTSEHPQGPARNPSTESSTSRTTAQSLTDGTSTTSMATPATTTRATSPPCPLTSTTPTTTTTALRPLHLLPRLWRRLRSGIAPRRGAPGTAHTPRRRGPSASHSTPSASGVATDSRTSPAEPSSAPTSARPLPASLRAWMTSIESAPPAVHLSESTATARPRPARVRVLDVCGAEPRPVYNLTMATDPSFVLAESGVVVHNCDALRYLVQSRARSAKSLMRRTKTYDERVQEFVTKRTVVGRKQVHDVLGTI